MEVADVIHLEELAVEKLIVHTENEETQGRPRPMFSTSSGTIGMPIVNGSCDGSQHGFNPLRAGGRSRNRCHFHSDRG